jgi:hypothetical protein
MPCGVEGNGTGDGSGVVGVPGTNKGSGGKGAIVSWTGNPTTFGKDCNLGEVPQWRKMEGWRA